MDGVGERSGAGRVWAGRAEGEFGACQQQGGGRVCV